MQINPGNTRNIPIIRANIGEYSSGNVGKSCLAVNSSSIIRFCRFLDVFGHFSYMAKTKRFLFAPPREDVDAMEKQTRSLEERLILRLEAYTGLRSCEIVGDKTHPGLRVEDVDFQREKLMVYGKGWATGKIPPKEQDCDKTTLELLKQLMVEKKIIQGKLFPSWYTRKHRRFIKALAIRAGVPHAKDMGTHRLRAHFVTHIIRKTGGNLSLARKLARHKDIRTTEKYVYLMDDEVAEAYHKVMDEP